VLICKFNAAFYSKYDEHNFEAKNYLGAQNKANFVTNESILVRDDDNYS
jgi:hypothetical protein